MKFLPFTKIRSIIVSVSILLLASGIGYRLGERNFSLSSGSQKRPIINAEPVDNAPVDFAIFWDAWQKVNQYYIEPQSIDTQKLVYGAISGMVSAVGDPYTSFFPPKENKEFKEDLGGEFEGIGAQLGVKDGRVIVVSPLKGAPAEKAGLKPNDFILKVDEEDTYGWSVEQAVTKIRGPKNTSVLLNILHETSQKPEDIKIVRSTITIPSVVSWIKSPKDITEIQSASESASILSDTKKVAYLELSRFGDHTNEDWGKAVMDIVNADARDKSVAGLVVDLRNNPGGYLDGSVFIGSEFIKSGIIVSQVNSDGSRQEYTVNRKGKLLDIPMVVLINKGSASAAEIVAGALRDYNRATIIGETSFGKGSVQTPFDLAGDTSVHITTGKWLLPKGDSISKKGIDPDITVEWTDTQNASADAQLARAIMELLQ